MDDLKSNLIVELNDVEQRAWNSLASHQYAAFGSWAMVWSKINNILGGLRKNPWSDFVKYAKSVRDGENTENLVLSPISHSDNYLITDNTGGEKTTIKNTELALTLKRLCNDIKYTTNNPKELNKVATDKSLLVLLELVSIGTDFEDEIFSTLWMYKYQLEFNSKYNKLRNLLRDIMSCYNPPKKQCYWMDNLKFLDKANFPISIEKFRIFMDSYRRDTLLSNNEISSLCDFFNINKSDYLTELGSYSDFKRNRINELYARDPISADITIKESLNTEKVSIDSQIRAIKDEMYDKLITFAKTAFDLAWSKDSGLTKHCLSSQDIITNDNIVNKLKNAI